MIYRPHPGIVLEHFMYEEHDFLIRCSDTPEISCTVVVICILATVLDEKVEGRAIINGLKERRWLAPLPHQPFCLIMQWIVSLCIACCS